METKIGFRIFKIEEEIDIEYQLEENFFALDLEKDSSLKKDFMPLEEFQELSYVEKKLKLIAMKKFTMARSLKLNKEFNFASFQELKDEKEFILAQQKNLHQYPYSFLEPMFETSSFYSIANRKDFVSRISKVNKWSDKAYFDLRKYYDIPEDMDAKNFGGILTLKHLQNITADDTNLDVIKFCEILSLEKKLKKDDRNYLERLFDSMF